MPREVILPKFGFTQESAEIVRWLKQPGEKVEAGDPIVEVTTDKVNMEVESPATGILDGLLYKEGETAPVATVIAYIRSASEPPMGGGVLAAAPASAVSSTPAPALAPAPRMSPVAANVARESGVDLSQVQGSGPGGRVMKRDVVGALPYGKVAAVPAARRLAKELGVDLQEVQGTGPEGRVQSVDVRAFQSTARAAPAIAPTPAPVPAAVPVPSAAPTAALPSNVLKVIPLTGMRLTIANRMQKSAQEAPHITFDADIDMTAAEALRTRANALLSEGQPKISLTVILAVACARALKRNPMMNSRLDGQQIVLLRDINLGIAVALEEGLIVPVVHGIDRKGLTEIAVDLASLVDKARNNRLRPEDVVDGTFTISNLGMFGVDRFTAIINPPQCAILAVGRIVKRIVPDENDRPVVRPLMTATLSADHRVVDGAVAARFLRDVRETLEHPELLLM